MKEGNQPKLSYTANGKVVFEIRKYDVMESATNGKLRELYTTHMLVSKKNYGANSIYIFDVLPVKK